MTIKHDAWAHCHRELQQKMSEADFERWIRPLRVEVAGNALKLNFANRWDGKKVQESYGELIESVAQMVTGNDSVEVRYNTQAVAYAPKPLRSEREGVSSSTLHASELEPKFTFDRFVTGQSKHVEKAMALDVAESFSDDVMSVVIFGDSGLGKSHLLHAIGHQIYEQNPEKAIKVAHSTSFVSEVTTILAPSRNREASTNDLMQQLQNKYSRHDVVLLEDLHRLVNKPKIQEEFLHLLNMWHEQGTKLAFTSLGPMADLEDLEPALRSRLLGGVSIHAMTPDEDTKVQILLHQADEENVNLPTDVAAYMAQQLQGDIRVLKGTLLSIVKAHSHSGPRRRPITVESVDQTISIHRLDRAPVTANRILDLVSQRFKVSVLDVKGSARVHSKLIPRQMGMLLAHELTSLPLTEIAKAFGRKDHTTVKNALSAIERKMKSDINLRRDYDWLVNELRK